MARQKHGKTSKAGRASNNGNNAGKSNKKGGVKKPHVNKYAQFSRARTPEGATSAIDAARERGDNGFGQPVVHGSPWHGRYESRPTSSERMGFPREIVREMGGDAGGPDDEGPFRRNPGRRW